MTFHVTQHKEVAYILNTNCLGLDKSITLKVILLLNQIVKCICVMTVSYSDCKVTCDLCLKQTPEVK